MTNKKKAHKSATSSSSSGGGKHHHHAARHPAAAAAAPVLTPTLLLHHAAFKNDVAELHRLLALRQYDVNSVDVYGNTALHIAVMLGHAEIVEQLLQCDELKIDLKNKHGFTPLSEATSFGDRALIGALWSGYKTRARRSHELEHFRSHLESLADFQATFFWRVESWIPFVTRWCPSDEFRLTKCGAKLRVDMSMLEWADMAWIKHPFTFIIHPSESISRETVGNEEAVEAGLAATKPRAADDGAAAAGAAAAGATSASHPSKQPFVIFSLDHEVGKWQCLNMNEQQEQAEAERLARRRAYEAKMAARHNKAAASAAAAAAPASPSSASGAAVPAAAPALPPTPEDVDLQYEIDDFQSAPISSAFSPGRLEFKPLASRSWTSWSSWTSMVGVGVAPPRIERVGEWDARVWSVGGIRLHMLKRFEHLSAAEVQEMKKRQKNFRSMLGSPAKLKKAMNSKEGEEATEDEDDEDDDDEQEEEAAGSASSVADGASKVKQQRRKARKLPEHRPSLPAPPASTVRFDRYFHAANQTAYRAVEMEQHFAKQRDEALHAEERGGAKVEVVELREAPEGKDDGDAAASSGGAVDADDDAEDNDVEDNEADAILQLEEQGADSSPSASPPVSASAASSSSMLLSESNSAPSYLHLGRRPLVTELTRQKYSSRLWMSTPASGPGSFPLDMGTIVGLAHMLLGSSYPQIVAKFEHFVSQELPPGFPVRITVPLMSTISIDVSVQSFRTAEHIRFEGHGMPQPSAASAAAQPASAQQQQRQQASLFQIPPHYTREEESEEEQHKRQQKYRKRWKAADADNKDKEQGAGGAGGAGSSA